MKRIGPWIAFYINGIPVTWPTYYTDFGIPTVNTPLGMGSEWIFYMPPNTSGVQVNSNIGLYASLNTTTGSPPTIVAFGGFTVQELFYQKTIENMVKDASSLGGVQTQSMEQTFSDNFANLSNWQ
jgi:hypothetical protein